MRPILIVTSFIAVIDSANPATNLDDLNAVWNALDENALSMSDVQIAQMVEHDSQRDGLLHNLRRRFLRHDRVVSYLTPRRTD